MGWIENLTHQFNVLSPPRRAALVVTALGSLAFFAWIALGAGRANYRLLYRGLPEDEVARVADVLSGERIPYRLEEGGTALYVPGAQVPEARIRVAGEGLPAGGSSGFELFDKPGFGVTDFVHRVNYRRALQGELARSIEQLSPVERARVQIALPERSPFVGETSRRPSASVVAQLRPGHDLEPTQVQGIVHLVASSVEALAPERVTVVDDRGRLLAPDGGAAGETGGATGIHSHQARLERELGGRIESILERTVGPGRVVARVRADLDWTRTERTEERFDPDSQVERSEQRSTESSAEGGLEAAGVPGVQSNLPGGGAGPVPFGAGASASRTSETVNYEISKTVSRSVLPVGQVERLTVAVLVDGQPGAADGEFEPWDEGSLQQFEELARQAVGFSEERGDRITVTSAPFRSIELDEEGGGLLTPDALVLLAQLLHYAGALLLLLLFGRLVVRPLARSVASPETSGLPARVGELELQLAGAAGAVPQVEAGAAGPSDALGAVARSRTDESVKTIRTWLRQS